MSVKELQMFIFSLSILIISSIAWQVELLAEGERVGIIEGAGKQADVTCDTGTEILGNG